MKREGGSKEKEMDRRTIVTTITITISITISMCSSLITVSYLAVEVHDVNASDWQLARRYGIGNSRAEQRGDGRVVHEVEVTDTRETLDLVII
jgi:hypothetical protein